MTTGAALEVVVCGGRTYPLLPHQFWHLAHTNGITLHNAFLAQGFVHSASFVALGPGMSEVVSPYGFGAQNNAKEQVWEAVRASLGTHLPSRIGAFFLFDDEDVAKTVKQKWFPGQDRVLVPARIVLGSVIHRADSRLLDALEKDWKTSAARYWVGEMIEGAIPEVIVRGSIYFPGWKVQPFGLMRP